MRSVDLMCIVIVKQFNILYLGQISQNKLQSYLIRQVRLKKMENSISLGKIKKRCFQNQTQKISF
ncbi:hypothetical protein TTHERM_01081640 (macronuclear) [Tetrahymena thermophila SB210]|uniref:Uncharacterized protein n=1 Tax=Tetrahymena thermophila (strain SB210) TaxID=312017 RepID=Q22C05_TETTS|nr:hypothetical protein TTHERM_01081640 [Tetrahymena thermophila SB210]EAR82804.2 hypothetical protein TTHERM_01081640 [Tetrahymena thermophila SB210]|eukprot:XP_001030467.2 hypothetical protein TTHERM_01081640 [Tetrahymena thermophila SB210]